MSLTRLLAVALLVLVIGLPAFAQEESDEGTAPATEESADTPAEETAPQPADTAPQPADTAPQPADATPAPSRPAPAPRATATPVPGPGTVVFSDNFEDMSHPNFPLTSRNPATQSQGYIDGQYEMMDGNPNGAVSELVPGTYPNSTVAVDALLTGGPNTAHAYIACRRAGSGGYQMNVLPQGIVRPQFGNVIFVGPRFQLVRLQDGGNVTLIDQGPSDAIRGKGEVNHMELTCAGSTITGSINGTEVFSVQDATYTTGRHRFGVSGNGATVRFDNLTVTLR